MPCRFINYERVLKYIYIFKDIFKVVRSSHSSTFHRFVTRVFQQSLANAIRRRCSVSWFWRHNTSAL